MIKKLLLFTISMVLFGNVAWSQRKLLYGKRYKDKLEANSKLLWAEAHQTLEKTADKKFVLKTYYPETRQMTYRVEYTDRTLREKSGKYEVWFDNGGKWKEGVYKNNKKHGLWKNYKFKTEQLSNYGEYINDLKDGEWNYLDSLGNIYYMQTYKNGELNGKTISYNKDGSIHKESLYKNGELVEEENKNAPTEEEEVFKIVEEMPHLSLCAEVEGLEERRNCSNQALLKYIYSNIKYPRSARQQGIQGKAYIQFIVEKDGSLAEIETLQGVCADIEAECHRVIKSLPDWEPGKQRGEAVKVLFTLPIAFRLE